jgi:hypothetical protein
VSNIGLQTYYGLLVSAAIQQISVRRFIKFYSLYTESNVLNKKREKYKDIPVTGSGAYTGCKMMIPHFLDNRLADCG